MRNMRCGAAFSAICLLSVALPTAVTHAVDPLATPEFTISNGANPYLMKVDFTADPRARYVVKIYSGTTAYLVSNDYRPGSDLSAAANPQPGDSCQQAIGSLTDEFGRAYNYCAYAFSSTASLRVTLTVVDRVNSSALPESPKSNPIKFLSSYSWDSITDSTTGVGLTLRTRAISGASSYVFSAYSSVDNYTTAVATSTFKDLSDVFIPVAAGARYKLRSKTIGGFSDNTFFLNSPWSALSNVSLYVRNRPNAVTNVRIVSTSNAELLVSWDPPTTGSKIDRYLVYLSTNKVNVIRPWEVSATADKRSQLITGLNPRGLFEALSLNLGTKYFAHVKAVGASPDDAVTETISDMAAAPLFPPRPPEATFTVADGRIDASWTKPNDPLESGEPARNYIIEVEKDGTTVASKSYEGDATGGFVDGLTNGVAYSVRVRARNGAGLSDSSGEFTSATPVGKPSISIEAISNVTRTTAKVIPKFDGRGNIGDVRFIFGRASSASLGRTDRSNFNDGVTLTNLSPGSIWKGKLEAVVGSTTYTSREVSFTTTPDAPTGLVATSTATSATVTWTNPSLEVTPWYSIWAESGGRVVGNGCIDVLLTTRTCVITGLSPEVVYTVRVTLKSSGGDFGNGTSLPGSTSIKTKREQTIVDGSAQLPKLYAGMPEVSLGKYFTSTSGLALTFTSSTTSVCLATSMLTVRTAGTCKLTLSQAGNTIFASAAPTEVSLTVAAPQVVTFDLGALEAKTVSSEPFSVSSFASASSGLGTTFSSVTRSVCIVEDATVTPVSAGQCTLIASQKGNESFLAAPDVSQAFTIGRGSQTTLSIDTSTGSFNTELTLSTSGGSGTGALSFSVNMTGNTSGCTATRRGIIAAQPGDCPVTATKGADANYNATSSAETVIVLTKASQVITFVQPPDQLEGSTFTAVVKSSAGLTVTLTSTTTSVCTVSGFAVTLLAGGGTCSLTASQAGSTSYLAATSITRTFESNQKAIPRIGTINYDRSQTYYTGSTVQFSVNNDVSGGLQSDVPGTFTWYSDSPESLEFSQTTPGLATVIGRNGIAAGMVQVYYLFVPAAPGSSTFNSAVAGAAFPIALKPQSITISPQTVPFGTPAKLTATGILSTGTVSFDLSPLDESNNSAIASNALCNVSGTTVTRTAPGKCSVRVSVFPDAVYDSGIAVRDIVFTKRAQSLWIENSDRLDDLTFADHAETVDLSSMAKSSEGLTVSVATSSTACSVNGGALAILSAGVCTLSLTQAGSSNYESATLDYSFRIDRAEQAGLFITAPDGTVGNSVSLSTSGGDGAGVVTFTVGDGTATGCSVANGVLSSGTSGTCLVVAGKASDDNYAAVTSRETAVTFLRRVDVLNFDFSLLSGVRPGGSAIELAKYASLASERLPEFASGSPEVCTVAESRISPIASGRCVISAWRAEDTEFEGVAQVTRSFEIESPPAAELAKMTGASAWTTRAMKGALGGKVIASSRTGASVSYSFASKTFTVWFGTGTNAGFAALAINGKQVRTVDLYSKEPGSVAIRLVTAAKTKSNRVTIRVVGRKNRRAKGFEVALDAISPSTTCGKGCLRNPSAG